MVDVILKGGKERSLLNGHPWIFSGAIKFSPKNLNPGDEVNVKSHKGEFLARGYYNPHSQIRIRTYSQREDQGLDASFLKERIAASIARRSHIDRKQTNAIRLVAHESDLLPGLVIDQYHRWVSFQILTAGMERHRETIISIIRELLSPAGIIERSDESVRKKEGLPLRKEVVFGSLPEGGVKILENQMELFVDLYQGHKTGFYIDQRDNREMIRHFAQDRSVLNCFSYTGGFTIAAAEGGASSVISVDESLPALKIAERNSKLIKTDTKFEFVQADVFQYLRHLKDEKKTFDLIILDPPKFANSSRNLNGACRGYKDLNLIAWQLLKDRGLLATFSCSGLISRDLFQKVVFGSTVDADCDAQIVKHLYQAEDHPTRLAFPESLYLKGFLLRKLAR